MAKSDEDEVFDDTEQAVDAAEKQGVDVRSVDTIAADYRKQFGRELPHPKMDATVERLAAAFGTGEKGLVFVRRVKSVDELRRKLNERYDDRVIDYVRRGLRPELLPSFDAAVAAYSKQRLTERAERNSAASDEPDGVLSEAVPAEPDAGDEDGFFAWYFRGQTPVRGLLAGGQFALRFNSAGAVLGTFFEDNHVSSLLGVRPGGVTEALAAAVGMSVTELSERLRDGARRRLPAVRQQQRGTVFLAYQATSLDLLAQHGDGELAQRARIVGRSGSITTCRSMAVTACRTRRL